MINHGDAAYDIERGDRIAQLLIVPSPRIDAVEVAELDATERGADGFGERTMKRHEPLHMKPTPTAFRIFRAFMVGITAALILIASARSRSSSPTSRWDGMVAGMG